MRLEIILPGSIRSKKNSKQIITIGGKKVPKRRIMVPSKAYQAWERAARKDVKFQLPPGFRVLESPVEVCVKAFCKGRLPDLSGVLESVGDCLEGLVWLDDKQIVSWDGSRVYHDLKDPHTEVTVVFG